MTVCTHDSLAGGGLFGHAKSAVRKIGFSRGVMANLWSYKSGVALWYRPMKSWLREGSPQFSTQKHAVQTR